MNADNLININDRPAEERRAIRSKGGKARAEKARAQKNLRDRLLDTLNNPYTRKTDYLTGKPKDRPFDAGDGDGTYYDELAYTIAKKALTDYKYTRLLLEIIGEMPNKDDRGLEGAEVVNIEWDE